MPPAPSATISFAFGFDLTTRFPSRDLQVNGDNQPGPLPVCVIMAAGTPSARSKSAITPERSAPHRLGNPPRRLAGAISVDNRVEDELKSPPERTGIRVERERVCPSGIGPEE